MCTTIWKASSPKGDNLNVFILKGLIFNYLENSLIWRSYPLSVKQMRNYSSFLDIRPPEMRTMPDANAREKDNIFGFVSKTLRNHVPIGLAF